jgi:hypothetical protein
MSCFLSAAAAAHDPNGGFDVFTILGIIGIILGIIVLALRVASHGHMDYTRHGDVGFSVGGAVETGVEPVDCEEVEEAECAVGER